MKTKNILFTLAILSVGTTLFACEKTHTHNLEKVDAVADNVSLGDSVKSLGTVIVIGITCLGEVYGILKGFFRYFNC